MTILYGEYIKVIRLPLKHFSNKIGKKKFVFEDFNPDINALPIWPWERVLDEKKTSGLPKHFLIDLKIL